MDKLGSCLFYLNSKYTGPIPSSGRLRLLVKGKTSYLRELPGNFSSFLDLSIYPIKNRPSSDNECLSLELHQKD
jgi:hypothetical protein